MLSLFSRKKISTICLREKKSFSDLPLLQNLLTKVNCPNISYVFYPYGKDLPKIQSEDDLQRYTENYYKSYLLEKKSELSSRPRKTENNWWTLSEYRAWQVEITPKLVSTYFGKSGSFAWDDSGSYAIINGFAWFPKKEKILPEHIGLAYLAILSCSFINNLLSSVSNHLGRGQWDLSKRYVNNMPLPNLMAANLDLNILESLHRIGSLIHSGQDFDSKALNQLVLTVYQLPENTISLLEF
jgi:adenine-specific DNA-methyltransferase